MLLMRALCSFGLANKIAIVYRHVMIESNGKICLKSGAGRSVLTCAGEVARSGAEWRESENVRNLSSDYVTYR